MLSNTEMMVVSRGILAEAQNEVLGKAKNPPQMITLHLNATQKFRDLVYGYLTGSEPFDKEIWKFLVEGGYFSLSPPEPECEFIIITYQW